MLLLAGAHGSTTADFEAADCCHASFDSGAFDPLNHGSDGSGLAVVFDNHGSLN